MLLGNRLRVQSIVCVFSYLFFTLRQVGEPYISLKKTHLSSNSFSVPFHTREFLVSLNNSNLSRFVKCWPIGTSFFPSSTTRDKVNKELLQCFHPDTLLLLIETLLVTACCLMFVDQSKAPKKKQRKTLLVNMKQHLHIYMPQSYHHIFHSKCKTNTLTLKVSLLNIL